MSMEHLRFENRVADLAVDHEARAARLAKASRADRCYVVLFSARSGSSWLTKVLSATKRLGRPEEFLNPNFVRGVAQNMQANRAEDLLLALKHFAKTPNGVFGLEARAVDVELLGYDAFAEAFAGEAIFFHLWRRNVVAQGLSLFKAVETQRFHSTDSAKAPPPDYNPEAIFQWIRHIIGTENGNVRLLSRLGVPARLLHYEAITADRQRTVEAFAHALAVPFKPDEFADEPETALSKIGDSWNTETEARLREEFTTQIAEMEATRMVLRGIAASPHQKAPEEPSLHEAWQRGHACGNAGRSPLNNPHKEEGPTRDAWRAGWAAGWDTQVYL